MEKMKKALVLILAFLVVFTLGGCGSAGQSIDLSQEDVQTEEEIYFDLDAYTMAGGMLNVTLTDGSVEETGGYGLVAKAGDTFGDALTSCGLKAVEPVLEGDTFEGWIIFEISTAADEDGFETYTYELRSGDTIYTTQELLDLAVPEYRSTVTAKWESVPLESYFVDDEDYMWEAGVTTGAFAFTANGGTMEFRSSDGDRQFENPTYTYWMEDGLTLDEVMVREQWDVLAQVKKDNAQFDGWTVYEADDFTWNSTPVNEGSTISVPFDRHEGFEYIVLENAKQHSTGATTQELCQIVNYSRYYVAVANWK